MVVVKGEEQVGLQTLADQQDPRIIELGCLGLRTCPLRYFMGTTWPIRSHTIGKSNPDAPPFPGWQ